MIHHITLSHEHLIELFAFTVIFTVLLLLDSCYGIITKIVQLTEHLSSSKKFLFIFLLSSFMVLSFWSNVVLQRFPDAGSEKVYIYQAKTFLKGRLWNTPPPADFFTNSRIISKDGKYFPKTFPGWSFLLSVALFFHIPIWLLNPILGTASLILLFFLGKLLYNNTIGLLSVLGAFCSPFFLFNASSYIPNISCGLLTLLAVYFYYSMAAKKQSSICLFWIGICLGGAYLIRPFSTLSCLVPILIALIIKRRENFFQKDIWPFLLGIGPFLLIFFLYNYFTTGNFLLTPFNLADPSDTVQFKLSVILENIVSVEHQILWVNPAIFIIYFFMVIFLSLKKKAHVSELIFFILVGSCFFYIVPEGYGDRYYFEGYLLCVLTVIGRIAQLKNGHIKRFLSLALITGFLISLLSVIFLMLNDWNTNYYKNELYRLVEKKHLSNVIVFVPPEGTSIVGIDICNDPDLQNKVLYANDLKERNALILKYFPDRNFYRYVPGEKNKDQKLQKYEIPHNVSPR